MMVRFHPLEGDYPLTYVVILATCHGETVYCRHCERDTWEFPGGHIEPGETAPEAARRELNEETGASAFTLTPLCVYSVRTDAGESYGALFHAEISALEPLKHEIAALAFCPNPPGAWTYPDIQPKLLAQAQQYPLCRRARPEDADAIAAIYEAIHDEIDAGRASIGWQRGVYPTLATARASIETGDMFVMEHEGRITAAAKINQEQVDVYADAAWRYPAAPEQVMVLHTLVVSPKEKGRGYGSAFVGFYERYALGHGCPYLRMDTNAINTAARSLYKKLGYEEVSILPCLFNGIPGVNLVCLEKYLG